MSDEAADRLSAEDDWAGRARAVERRLARARAVERRLAREIRRARRSGGAPPADSARGISKLFLALLAVTLAGGWALWAGYGPTGPTTFVFVLSGWLVTLCLHEFSHALTAYWGGDHTVADKGYLRLDPRRYGHPILTLALPLVLLIVGGIPLPGAAVLIEQHRLRNRLRDSLVSAAGPAVDIAAAAALLVVVSALGPAAIYELDAPRAPFWAALTLLAYVQVAVTILNLLPVPGLDGFGMIEPYLPESRRPGNPMRLFAYLLLFAAIFFTPLGRVFAEACGWVVDAAGAPINGDYYGWELFQFWTGW